MDKHTVPNREASNSSTLNTQVLERLRTDYNSKVEEVVSLRDDVMTLQVISSSALNPPKPYALNPTP
jgi:hypothetical protein